MSKKQNFYSSTSENSSHTNANKNKKYKQKPQVILKLQTHYIPLIPLDIIYRENLSHLSNRQYQHALQKILMDLNALLYFNQDDFFQQLSQSSTLRSCLQSCLTCLGKNSYYNVSSKRILAINRQQIHIPNQYFYYYQKLHEILLKIYHRISHATKQEHKQIVYDCWLMDMPKMIDLAIIFCVRINQDFQEDSFANSSIMKEIIAKAISTNPNQYSRDFDDFINILYQDKLPLIHKDMQLVINLQQEAMEYAKINFANPQRSFLITSNKILFEIKDLFTIVSNIYLSFPQVYKNKLATDHQVLQDMIKIFIQFVQSTALWKTGKHKEKFLTNFQAIHQACCQNFYMNFKIIKDIIQKGDSLKNQFYSRALNSYCVHSMYFTSPKINKDHQKIYQQMVKTIVYRFQHEQQMFFLSQTPSNLKFIKISENQKVAIRKSHEKINQFYQQIYQIIENQQVQRRIKGKIERFFQQAEKIQKNNLFSEENRMAFNGRIKQEKINRKKQQEIKKQEQKIVNEKQKQQQQQKQKPDDISLDFQAENESNKNQQEQDSDLSFEALKDSNQSFSYHEQLSFEDDQPQISQKVQFNDKSIITTNLMQKSEPTQPTDPELYSQLQEKQNQLQQTYYKRSPYLLYNDEYQQAREEREDYYKSHKLQYGHYMGRLLQRK